MFEIRWHSSGLDLFKNNPGLAETEGDLKLKTGLWTLFASRTGETKTEFPTNLDNNSFRFTRTLLGLFSIGSRNVPKWLFWWCGREEETISNRKCRFCHLTEKLTSQRSQHSWCFVKLVRLNFAQIDFAE